MPEWKRKRKAEIREHILIGVLSLLICGAYLWLSTEEYKTEYGEEQKYLVRYATVQSISKEGVTTYRDTYGNEWEYQDAPLEKNVRLLFDSRNTKDIHDDIIVDITEWKTEIN